MSVIRITASLFLVTVITVAPLYAQDEAAIPALDPAVSMPNLVAPEPAILSDTTAVVDVTDQEAMEIPAEGSDIVLILDNSSSMKTNDPQSQLAGAVTGFVAKLDETANIGIFIFDQTVKLALPLIPATLENRERKKIYETKAIIMATDNNPNPICGLNICTTNGVSIIPAKAPILIAI